MDETRDDAPRSYLILGAAGGIGSAVSRELARDGHRLLLAGRASDRLRALADAIDRPSIEIDARDADAVQGAVEEAATRAGRLDGVANCVGSLLLKPAHLTTADEWTETLATNLGSAFATVRAAAPALRDGGGSIVLVSSAAARIGLANHEAIAAAKAGVVGLTLAAAASYARWNVRVNAVAPGLVRTPLTRRLTASETAEKASTAMHALGRLGEPEDVASAIRWLLDPRQRWMTGQLVGIDGGLGTVRSGR